MPIVTHTVTENTPKPPKLSQARIKEILESPIDEEDEKLFPNKWLKNAEKEGRIIYYDPEIDGEPKRLLSRAERQKKQTENTLDRTGTKILNLKVKLGSEAFQVGKRNQKLLEKVAAKLLNGWTKGEISLQKRA